MIRINDDWIINVDRYQYTLAKDTHREKEKYRYDAVGHYSTLTNALNALLMEMVKDKLKDGEIELCEAVRAINDCKAWWEQMTQEIVSDEV